MSTLEMYPTDALHRHKSTPIQSHVCSIVFNSEELEERGIFINKDLVE